MYCSSCGGTVASGLDYCSHCGARLNRARAELVANQSELFPDSLVWAIVTVFIIGLGGTIGLMAVMEDVFGKANLGLIIAFSLLTLLLTVGVEVILIWLLLSRRKNAKTAEHTERPMKHTTPKKQTTNELEEVEPRSLPEPLPSVTEHTTRVFDPIHSERKSS